MKIRNKWIRRLTWIIIIGMAALAFSWVVIPLALESVIAAQVHTKFSHLLGVPVSVSAVDVDWRRRKIGLYGLRVAQPEGFGHGDLLYAAEVETVIRLRSLLSGSLDLIETRMAHMKLDIYTDANGKNGLQQLVDTIRTKQDDDAEKAEPRDGPLNAIAIRSLAATDGTVTFRENTDTNQIFELTVRNITMDGWDLRWGNHATSNTNKTGMFLVTGRLHQRPFRDGRCGLALETGVLGGHDPFLDCHLRLVGIELASLAPFLPSQTAAILGGDALDLSVDMGLNGDSLTGQAMIETIAGYQYTANLSGTPTEPTVTTDSDAVAYVFSRTGGGFSNVLRNLHWTGKGAAGAIAGAVSDLASGTVKTVGSFGEGLLRTAKGVVTFDSSDIGQGTKSMGTAITGGATDAIIGAGGGIIKGAGSITHGLTGGEAAEQWRQRIPARWEKVWQDAIAATPQEEQ